MNSGTGYPIYSDASFLSTNQRQGKQQSNLTRQDRLRDLPKYPNELIPHFLLHQFSNISLHLPFRESHHLPEPVYLSFV
jgi:hypothetical protein